MSEYDELSEYIERCDSDDEIDEGYVRVVLNRKSRKTWERMPVIVRLFKDHAFFKRYVVYRVRVRGSVDLEPLSYEITDFTSKDSLRIQVSVRAKCPKDNAHLIVKSLDGPEGVENNLLDLLKDWLTDELDGQENAFINDFKRQAKSLSERIASVALDKCGLSLRINIAPEPMEETAILLKQENASCAGDRPSKRDSMHNIR